MARSRLSLLGLVLTALVLGGACGGGGGGGDNTPPASSGPDLQLIFLELSAGDLEEPFDPAVFAYTARVPFSVSAVRVRARARSAEAVVAVRGQVLAAEEESAPVALDVGPTLVDVAVTVDAETLVYSVTVVREGSAALSALSASAGELLPAFDPGVLAYELVVPGAVTEVLLTPTAEEPGATLVAGGVALVSGAASAPIALAVGSALLAIEVTSADGRSQTYSITLTRGPSPNLAVLALSAGSLAPDFAPTLSDYDVEVGFLTPSIEVAATPEDPSATVRVAGVEAPPDVAGDAGLAVAIGVGGNTIPVEVTATDGTTRTYALHVTRASADTFAHHYLKASNTGASDTFGVSLALSGDTLAVGAFGEDSDATGVDGDAASDAALGSGAVYVFVREAGVWRQEAYLKASNTGRADRFGRTVALHGDTLAVGADFEDSADVGLAGDGADDDALQAGAVYVFTRAAGVWSQEAYLKASNTGAGDSFGAALALGEDLLAVGADAEDGPVNALADAGAVYVFARAAGVWSEEALLRASNAGAQDAFGSALALSNDLLVVGAFGEDSDATGVGGSGADDLEPDSGAAYVFRRGASAWTEEAYLKASNTSRFDLFGISVAASGDTLAVGAFGEDGAALGIDGDSTSDAASGAGAVYVFTREASAWNQTAYIKASNTSAGDSFGRVVALDGDVLAVGAPEEDSEATHVNGAQGVDNALSAGAVYLFTRAGGAWAQEAYLKASNTGAFDDFGATLGLDGDTLAVGAPLEDGAETGIDGDETSEDAPAAGAVYVRR